MTERETASQKTESSNATRLKKGLPTWLKVVIIAGGVFVVVIAGLCFTVAPFITQLLQPTPSHVVQQKAKAHLVLRDDSTFKPIQSYDVMGKQIFRLEDGKTGQEFLMVTGLDAQTAENLTKEMTSTYFVQTAANTFIKMRSSDSRDSFVLEKIETLEKNTQRVEGRDIEYQRLKVHFHLGSDPATREYEAGVGRVASADGKNTLVLSYSKAGDFHGDLVNTFFRDVSVKSDGPGKSEPDKKS